MPVFWNISPPEISASACFGLSDFTFMKGRSLPVLFYFMCEHRFCSQTKTRGDRNCTACFSLANIFSQSTNKSFGAKLQSEVTGGFTQVRIGNLINQSATSCAISIPPLLEDCSEQKTFKDVARRRLR